MRGVLRSLRLGVRALRFRLWALRLRTRLARSGGRLVLEAPRAPEYWELPDIEAWPEGGGGGTLTLRIGRGVHLGRRLTLDVWAGGDSVLEIGDGVVFQSRVRLQLWNGAIRIAATSQIRDMCELKSKGELVLGEEVILGRSVTLHCEERVELRAQVGLAERVTVEDSDHVHDGSDTYFLRQPLHVAPVLIDRNVFCGTNAVILRGTTIGPNSIVGAGAVVRGGDYPGGWVIAGVPARPVKALAQPSIAGA